MATFISLLNFTDQGIRNVKDSPDRYEEFRKMAEEKGVRFTSVYWTVGHYDVVAILEGSEEAVDHPHESFCIIHRCSKFW